jgi:signal transduction histidine kinase
MISLKFPNIKIRYRLIVGGIVFGSFAMVYLFFMSYHSNKISAIYEQKSFYWDTIYQIKVVSEAIVNYELENESINNEKLQNLNLLMNKIVQNLEGTDTNPKNLQAIFHQWMQEKLALKTSTHKDLVKNLNLEAQKIQTILLKKDENLKAELEKYIKTTKLVSTYISSIFFFGFFLYMISLWNLLLPDLQQLVKATHEFKSGNLSYRIQVSGSTETAELAKLFNEMADSIEKTNHELKELIKLKSDFVSTVSHELRTPLTSIKGSLALILGGLTGPITDKTKEMLSIAEQSTDRLIRLINDILDISKIEAKKINLKFKKESLTDIILQAIKNVETFAKQNQINLYFYEKEEDPIVAVDRDKMIQILVNLLSNGIKFTEPGGSVTVEYEPLKDKVLIHVTDTGQGMSEDFLKRAFQKFQQAENADNKKQPGTGLGLAIVKGLTEAHGGQVSVKSTVGVGSKFTISVPWNGFEYNKQSHTKAA